MTKLYVHKKTQIKIQASSKNNIFFLFCVLSKDETNEETCKNGTHGRHDLPGRQRDKIGVDIADGGVIGRRAIGDGP